MPTNTSYITMDIIDELASASTEKSFVSIGDRAARRLGFKSFAYLGSNKSDTFLLSSYPRPWTKRYFERTYQQIDPVIKKSKTSLVGFYWDATRLSGQLTRAQRQFFSEAIDFGVRNGVTIPIHTGFGQLAALTLAGDERERDFPIYAREALDDLHFIALTYHIHARAKLQLKLDHGETTLLTQRELQCLVWSANGKTMTEIANILNRSERTVRFHLDNVKAKLSVATVAAAVHEATQRGFLPP